MTSKNGNGPSTAVGRIRLKRKRTPEQQARYEEITRRNDALQRTKLPTPKYGAFGGREGSKRG
jgi:hypothetical protein